jgi:UDP-glucose 4-epimerase
MHRHVGVGALSGTTDWGEALDGCTAVVHLAAQLPGRDATEDILRTVNDEATAALVQQASSSGVRQFVFMSSIGAITGNASSAVITDATDPSSTSAYGRSKLAAERHVTAFSGQGRVGVSLRPPMVYGADAGGNWRLLQKLAASGLPLPMGSVGNRRSMIGVDTLADAVAAVLAQRDDAPGGAFALADTDPISLTEALRLLREGMSRPARLIPVPPSLLSGLLRAAGKGGMVDSLLGDLVIDSSRFRNTFGWGPKESIRDGIRRSGAGFAAAC